MLCCSDGDGDYMIAATIIRFRLKKFKILYFFSRGFCVTLTLRLCHLKVTCHPCREPPVKSLQRRTVREIEPVTKTEFVPSSCRAVCDARENIKSDIGSRGTDRNNIRVISDGNF